MIGTVLVIFSAAVVATGVACDWLSERDAGEARDATTEHDN